MHGLQLSRVGLHQLLQLLPRVLLQPGHLRGQYIWSLDLYLDPILIAIGLLQILAAAGAPRVTCRSSCASEDISLRKHPFKRHPSLAHHPPTSCSCCPCAWRWAACRCAACCRAACSCRTASSASEVTPSSADSERCSRAHRASFTRTCRGGVSEWMCVGGLFYLDPREWSQDDGHNYLDAKWKKRC